MYTIWQCQGVIWAIQTIRQLVAIDWSCAAQQVHVTTIGSRNCSTCFAHISSFDSEVCIPAGGFCEQPTYRCKCPE